MSDERTRLAVLGSPIAHSKSPALHAAAYSALGFDWRYDAIDVTTETLSDFVHSCGPEWRGLSLTMPLKNDVVALADAIDDITALTAAGNTLLFVGGSGARQLRVFNTDVWGIQQAFERANIHALETVVILGGGATAASAIVAATRLGARDVVVAVRSPEKTESIVSLARNCGADVRVIPLGEVDELGEHSAVISTLPGGTPLGVTFVESVRRGSVLFDVAYEPWPSDLARQWVEAGGRIIPGIDMLIYQALVQIRIFTTGDPESALHDEESVIAAMRAAVGA